MSPSDHSRSGPARAGHGPKHAPRVPFALLVVALVVGGMSLLLALNTASAANELRRHDLAVKDAGLTAQLQQLRNQVAASSAPGALGAAAAALGMVPAANPAFLQIGADGRVTVLGSPAPASAVLPPPPPPTPTHAATTTRPAKPSGTAKPKPASSTARPTTRSTAKATPPVPPTPTHTPTPTTTLPGGPR